MENKLLNTENELRAIKTFSAPGQLTIPELIYEKVIEVAEQKAIVASRVNIVEPKGLLKVLANMSTTPAKIADELTNAELQALIKNLDYKSTNITQARLLSAIESSKQYMENGISDEFREYLKQELANDLLLGIEDYMFNTHKLGTYGEILIQNIFTYNSENANRKIEDIAEITSASATSLSYTNLEEAYDKFANHSGNLSEDAVWVVENIKMLSSIKDDSGQSVLKRENRVPYSVGSVFGIPVFKTAKFTTGQKAGAVLMNPKKAYLTVVKKEANFVHAKPDTYTGLNGSDVFIGDVYVGGSVVNPRAIVILKTA
ncbi:phage major capsid protein [Bacillus altitudinis]|uniref:phage major capsid protein n=1 Tax=Bacillus altitudinis TaxID=293387 RepID=UPI00272A2C1E|nr:phage major capsid protein [Bacillus altitudinis]WLF29201.1 phage major capsid protein [Bacillus altitudinis]